MDLHSGLPYWIVKNELYDYFNPLDRDYSSEVVIIGGGITGALIAHELCKAGFECCVIDKRTLATGSSAASTALLQYEIDVPLCEMVDKVGKDNAVLAYQSCLQSILDIEHVLKEVGVDAEFEKKSSLFYAANRKGLTLLKKEYEIRRMYGLPVEFLDKDQLFDQFHFKAKGALLNRNSAQMDVYKAATGLLKYHMDHDKLKIFSPTEIVKWDQEAEGYILYTAEGFQVKCKHLVIAAGFEAGMFLPENVMKLTSTYAFISYPVPPEQLWPERCLIWETATPYLYLRTTKDNHVIVGGEDENFSNPAFRDRLLKKKVAKLEKKFKSLFPEITLLPEVTWCGTFSSTDDGLPYIGCWPGLENMYFALGYGGNGITFSMIAAQIIRNKLKGQDDRRESVFSFQRVI